MEKYEEEFDLLWLEVEMDKYYLSCSSGELDDNLAHAEEADNSHNVVRRATKKYRREKKNNPTQLGIYKTYVVQSHPTITTNIVREHELDEKLKEDSMRETIDAM